MKDGYSLETFRPTDVLPLANFLKEEYPFGEPANVHFLDWEYLRNTFGPAIITVAKDGNQHLASQYALLPIQVRINDKKTNASLSLNTLTGSKHRGKGLFVETAEAAFRYCHDEDIYFTIGIPNRNSYPGFIKRLGFKHVGNLVFSIKPLRAGKILASFFKKAKSKKGEEIKLKFNGQSMSADTISRFNPLADRNLYDVFIERWRLKRKVAINRSVEYLTWRYMNHPTRQYDLFKFVDGNEMQALIILRTLHVYGMNTTVLMDDLSTDELAGKQLMSWLTAELRQNDIDIIISANAAKDDEYKRLNASGFISLPSFMLPQQLPFIVRQHQQFAGADLILKLKNWHLMFGDYDIF